MTLAEKPEIQRLRITLRGAVQGVGFRPFVFRLATEMSLTGWVLNSSAGLVVEVEGPAEQLTRFEQRLEQGRPKASVVTVHESTWIAPEGSTRFEIHASDSCDSIPSPRTRSTSVRPTSSQSARSKMPGSRSSQRPWV